jgi:hypothetical protein
MDAHHPAGAQKARGLHGLLAAQRQERVAERGNLRRAGVQDRDVRSAEAPGDLLHHLQGRVVAAEVDGWQPLAAQHEAGDLAAGVDRAARAVERRDGGDPQRLAVTARKLGRLPGTKAERRFPDAGGTARWRDDARNAGQVRSAEAIEVVEVMLVRHQGRVDDSDLLGR